MQIELGKDYKTRAGGKVKITNIDFAYARPCLGIIEIGKDKYAASFYSNGAIHNHKESQFDIISEWQLLINS